MGDLLDSGAAPLPPLHLTTATDAQFPGSGRRAGSRPGGTTRISRSAPTAATRRRSPLSGSSHAGPIPANTVTRKRSGSGAAARAAVTTPSRSGRVAKRVDAVGHLAGDGRQLGPEDGDDDRRRRVGAQEAVDLAHRARPDLADHRDVLGQCRPALGVVGGHPAQGQLLGDVGAGRAGPGAEPEQQPAAGHLLQGGRHLGHHPGVPVGLVQDQWPEHHPAGHRGQRRQQRPRFEHVVLAVDDARQVVPGPHPAVAPLLGGNGQVADLRPGGLERIDQEVQVHPPPSVGSGHGNRDRTGCGQPGAARAASHPGGRDAGPRDQPHHRWRQDRRDRPLVREPGHEAGARSTPGWPA